MSASKTKNSLVKTNDIEQTMEKSELISNESPMMQPASKADSLRNINKKNRTAQEFTVTHFVTASRFQKKNYASLQSIVQLLTD